MAHIREDIKKVQYALGRDTIDVEMDARYSNPTHRCVGNTPYQAATQMTPLVAENLTKENKIIARNSKSKLCQVCALARTQNRVPPPPHKCTASLDATDLIGNERLRARELIADLADDGINVEIVTNDPDGSAFRGVEDAYVAGECSLPPRHQLNMRHVGSNQSKKIKNTDFSKKMFGMKKDSERKTLTSRFASDLSTRCSVEHHAAMNFYGGDVVRVTKKMPLVRLNLIQCYSGVHTLCRKYSFVCEGKNANNWISNSSYLKRNFRIDKPTNDDLIKLKECIHYRLGHGVLGKTKYLLSTQKCEAVNKAISATVPRNLTFSRNHDGRTDAAIHTVNFGIGAAILTECEQAGVGLTHGTRVTRHLWKMQREREMLKLQKKSPATKAQRKRKRKRLYAIHAETTENKTNSYVKNASLIPEHSYCRA